MVSTSSEPSIIFAVNCSKNANIQVTNLIEITIPDGVTKIWGGAFFNCNNLTAVTFLGDAPEIQDEVFQNATPTIYREPEAKGWGDTFSGRPVKLISEKP